MTQATKHASRAHLPCCLPIYLLGTLNGWITLPPATSFPSIVPHFVIQVANGTTTAIAPVTPALVSMPTPRLEVKMPTTTPMATAKSSPTTENLKIRRFFSCRPTSNASCVETPVRLGNCWRKDTPGSRSSGRSYAEVSSTKGSRVRMTTSRGTDWFSRSTERNYVDRLESKRPVTARSGEGLLAVATVAVSMTVFQKRPRIF